MATHSKEDLVLYYAPNSTAETTFDVLALLDIPYTLETIDLKSKPQKLLDLNPNFQVPVLVHHGIAIYESAACCIYASETFGVQRGLYPALSPERGQALSWIVFGTADLGAGIVKVKHAKDEITKKEGRDKTVKCMQILDDHLQKNDFVIGKSISTVDVQLAAATRYVKFLAIDTSEMQAVSKWQKKVADILKKTREASASKA